MPLNFWRITHVGEPITNALVTDKGRITFTNEQGREISTCEITPAIGKFLVSLGRPIGVRPIREAGAAQEGTEYTLSIEFTADEAAAASKRFTGAIGVMFKSHQQERLRRRTSKMMRTISLVTQYQSTDVPVIPGLRRQPTMYQLQNALWMEKVENILDGIEFETTSSIRLKKPTQVPLGGGRLGAPPGVRAETSWWDPVNGVMAAPADHRVFRLLGGILLDEAGIGKTMSALMHGYFNNRSDVHVMEPDAAGNDPKPMLNTETGLVRSGATLVVTRNHLVKQWEGELREVFRMDRTCSGPTVIVIQDGRQWKKLYARQVIQADFVIISLEFLTGNGNAYNSTVFPPSSLANFVEFRGHNRKAASAMTSLTQSPSLHAFHFNRVVFDEIQNLYSTAAGKALLGTSPAVQVHGCARAVNVTATHRWGLSASAFSDENDVLSILCILCDQIPQVKYTYSEYTPLIESYRDWAGLIFRRNTRETITKEIPMRKVTRQICRIQPTSAEMKIYNSILAGSSQDKRSGLKDLQMFCACPRLSDETAELQECGSIDDVAHNLYRKYETQIADESRELRDREIEFRESLSEWIAYLQGSGARVRFMASGALPLTEATRFEHVVVPEGWHPADQYVSEVISTLRNNARNAQLKVDNTTKKLDNLNRGLKYMKDEVIGAIDREEVTECPVCFEEFGKDRPVNVTKCGHTFCGVCIKDCINNNHICPTCKAKITRMSDIYVISTPEELSNLLKTLGSKVGVLVSLLKRVISETSENVIVFSEWDNLLRYTGNLLNSVGIKTLFMSGNASAKTAVLRKFNDATTTDGYRVLMLSSKKSAEGTNLTRATKIVFMDPIYGEGRDLIVRQAIGRSMRMNQKSDIEVINLVLAGTVEEEEIGKLESGLMDIQIDLEEDIEVKGTIKPMKGRKGRRA
jgi:SNF2 family DNA or RNA helicase